MATVTLLQPTDMDALPTSIPATTLVQGGPGFIGVSNLQNDLWMYLGGAFTSVSAGHTGTISNVLMDTDDEYPFPNLEITGLAYNFDVSYSNAVIYDGNMFNLAYDLLSGNDTLTGSKGNDTILGFEGNDTLIGGGGDDLLNGGGGIDTVSYASAPAGLFAGLEDNVSNTGAAAGDSYFSVENLIGSAYEDFLAGTDDNNRFTGGGGNDLMVGKGGADTFDGGTGTDTVAYDGSFPYSGNFAIRADLLSPGTNTGDAVGDVYISVENLEGSGFDDILLGNNNANVMRGNHFPVGTSGDDQLFGRGGNDTLFGNDQDDRLIGGTGRDIMTGGDGADDFDFNAVAETGTTGSTRDRITDFTHLTDDIDLSTIDANGGAAGNTAFSFLAAKGAAFTGVRGQLRWFQQVEIDKTIIAGDINGDSVADFQIELTGLKTLTAADFFL